MLSSSFHWLFYPYADASNSLRSSGEDESPLRLFEQNTILGEKKVQTQR